MDKDVLLQYGAIKREIKTICREISQLDCKLDHKPVVSDVVCGSRQDLTIGSIKVTGARDSEDEEREKHMDALEKQKARLSKQARECEEYIEGLKDPEMRDILRRKIIEEMTNAQIARDMNAEHPNRGIKYTDENIKKRIQRFFKMSPNVP